MIALHRSVHRIIKLHRVILRNSDRSWKIEVDSNRFPPLLRCIAVIVRLLPSIVSSPISGLLRSISGQFPFFFSVTINLVLYFPFCFSFSTESRGKEKTSRSKEGAIGTSVERRPRGENLSVES